MFPSYGLVHCRQCTFRIVAVRCSAQVTMSCCECTLSVPCFLTRHAYPPSHPSSTPFLFVRLFLFVLRWEHCSQNTFNKTATAECGLILVIWAQHRVLFRLQLQDQNGCSGEASSQGLLRYAIRSCLFCVFVVFESVRITTSSCHSNFSCF